MTVTISVKPIANDDSVRWAVLATLDVRGPGRITHHFAVGATCEHEALGIAADLLAAMPAQAAKSRFSKGPLLEAVPVAGDEGESGTRYVVAPHGCDEEAEPPR